MEKHRPSRKEDHGSIAPYVIGFILSLIYTILPYQLVVNKVFTGNTLVLTILGIAILQMIIQLLFFLHLGRGPKPFYNVVFFFATAATIVVVVGASLIIMNNLYRNMSPNEIVLRQAQEENIAQVDGQLTGACNQPRENHLITIQDGKTSPVHVTAQRCDTITFLDEDKQERELGFGLHPQDVSYGGVDVIVLKGDPETMTLNQAGDFFYHDHLDARLSGSFTVVE